MADSAHFNLLIKYDNPFAMGVKEGFARRIQENAWQYSDADGKCVIEFNFRQDNVYVDALKSTDIYECGFAIGVPGTLLCLTLDRNGSSKINFR